MSEPDPTSTRPRTDAAPSADAKRAHEAVDAAETQTSSLPEAESTGEPGEEVLGGADAVPLPTDAPSPKDAGKSR